ncbi:MAG: hypothetical protein FWD32_02900 [Firmicutes bacterium]|nr:hypothetical protein [Bacillota bacterium]
MVNLLIILFFIFLGLLTVLFIPIKAYVLAYVDVINLKIDYDVKLFNVIRVDKARLTLCNTGVNQTRPNGKQIYISYSPCKTRGYFEGVFGNQIAMRSKLKVKKLTTVYGNADNSALTALLAAYTTPVFADNIFKIDAIVKVKTSLRCVLISLYVAFKKYLKAASYNEK